MIPKLIHHLLLAALLLASSASAFDMRELENLRSKIGALQSRGRSQPADRNLLDLYSSSGRPKAESLTHSFRNSSPMLMHHRSAFSHADLQQTSSSSFGQNPQSRFLLDALSAKGSPELISVDNELSEDSSSIQRQLSEHPRFLSGKKIGADEIRVTYELAKPKASKKLSEFTSGKKAKKGRKLFDEGNQNKNKQAEKSASMKKSIESQKKLKGNSSTIVIGKKSLSSFADNKSKRQLKNEASNAKPNKMMSMFGAKTPALQKSASIQRKKSNVEERKLLDFQGYTGYGRKQFGGQNRFEYL